MSKTGSEQSLNLKTKFLDNNMVKGKVIQFRRGRKTIHERHFLIEIPGVDSRAKAAKFVGKEVVWKSSAGKEIS